MKVLIVEDEFVTKEFLRKFLSKYGECHAVNNGQQAVESFKQSLEDNEPYDLVCMDIMMPVMDGKTAVKKIRSLEQNSGVKAKSEVKVIMITALDDPRNVIEAMYQSGANSYVSKPISKDKLQDELSKLFGKL